MTRGHKAELAVLEGKPPRPRRRPSRAVAGAAAVAVLLAAVVAAATYQRGTTTAAPTRLTTTPAAAVHTAASTAAKATSLHLDLTVTVSGPISLTEHLTVDHDAVRHTSHLVTTAPHVRLEVINTGSAMYVRTAPTGKWTEVTLDPSIAAKIEKQFNPAAGELALLQKLSSTVTKVGPGTSDGVPTTHYTATINWKKLFTTASAAGFGSTQQLAQLEGAVSGGTGTVDVELDAQQRLRAERFTMGLTIQGQTLKITLDGTYSNYGEHVQINVPAASQVAATHHASTLQQLQTVLARLTEAGTTTSA